MTLRDRADAYAATFPKQKASHLQVVQEQGRDVLYGRWVLGQDYRNKTRYYGAYPPGYLDRVRALFPDLMGAAARAYLHAFSGALPQRLTEYVRCDEQLSANPWEFACRVEDLPSRCRPPMFGLVLADPPYSAADSEKYQTRPINRGRCTRALGEITVPGGFLVWLDTTWPMHSKTQWVTVGRIGVTRSTNHRERLVSIFERVAA